MILLIEMQCKAWEHNRVNMGMIKLIKAAFPMEDIKLYAESQHIFELNKLNRSEEIKFVSVPIEFYDWRQENQDSRDRYIELLDYIIEQEPETRKIVLLSCNKGIVLACDKVSRKYPHKVFNIILHAAAEEIAHHKRRNIKEVVHGLLSDIYHRRFPFKSVISMKECMEKCISSNCSFIIYSPNYKSGLRGKLSDDVIDKISFLHHPFYDSQLLYVNNEYDKKIKIGIYGQAVNRNALEIVKTYNLHYDNGLVIFQIITKNNNELITMKNVKRLFPEGDVSNEALEDAINQFDYILIPYSHDQYIVTASGIFADAVSQGRPLLMLDSPFFEFYNKYEIGYTENSIDAMARRISSLKNTAGALEFSNNARKLKQISFEENMEAVKRVLSI